MKTYLPAIIFLLTFTFNVMYRAVAQKTSTGWFIVFEEKMTAASPAQFMKAQKEGIDLLKKFCPEIAVFAWQNDDNTLYRIIPISGFASIDTLYEKMEFLQAHAQTEKGNSDASLFKSSTITASVMKWVPELSFITDKQFSLSPGQPYSEWMYAYIIPGQETAAILALSNFRDYYIKNKLDYPWDVFKVLFGTDTPVIIGLFRAESQSALQLKGKKIWEKHGNELGRLWDAVVQCTWKIENKPGWFNLSLSNLPVIKPDEKITGGL